VRNLLLGPKRYSDLLEELPGITTNLLALRLREMERAGLVARREARPPVRAQLYELGENGRALEPAIMELARWGNRFMSGANEDDTINIAWGLLSLKRRYRGGLRLVAELRVGERRFELAFEPGYLTVSERDAARPEIAIEGSLEDIRAWLFFGEDGAALRFERRLRVDGSDEHWAALLTAFTPRETWPEELLEKSRRTPDVRPGA
jgi:DNA-binding HxlR family transcriptional regulator